MSTRCQIEFYDGEPVDGAEPAARIYNHSDGYPKGILPLLKKLEGVLRKDIPRYGPRLDDPEWAAAEFVSLFRLPSSEVTKEWEGIERNGLRQYGGTVYVSQQIHPDIEYLYRVICKPTGWDIRIFVPKHDERHDIAGFEPYAEVKE